MTMIIRKMFCLFSFSPSHCFRIHALILDRHLSECWHLNEKKKKNFEKKTFFFLLE